MHATQAPGHALTELRRYWDVDATTYDAWRGHGAWSLGERAAWAAALERFLPAPPARVLDVGAGSGFLSLEAARQGHTVTALDISAAMLDRLRGAAAREDLAIERVRASAEHPPPGPFDATMERNVLWTLPDPVAALRACLDVTPGGRLLAFESVWQGRDDYAEALRRRARRWLHRVRRAAPEHHGEYPPELEEQLPLAREARPETMIAAIAEAGWRDPRLYRLRDVEWARLLTLPPLERLLGVAPAYVVVAQA